MPTALQRSTLGLWSVCTSTSYWLQGNIWQGGTSNQRPPPHLSLALCFAFCQTSSFFSSHLAIWITRIFVVINMCQTSSATSNVPRLIQYKNWRQTAKAGREEKASNVIICTFHLTSLFDLSMCVSSATDCHWHLWHDTEVQKQVYI